MTRQEAMLRLRKAEAQLRARGVAEAWLFGSVARGTATEASDIDVVVRFTEPDRISLFDLAAVHADISEAVQRDVSLLERHEIAQRPEFEANFLRDAVRVI